MTMPRTDWIMIALIFIMGLFAAAQFIKISLLLDPLAAHYGTSVALISLLVSLVGLIGITFGLVAGDVVAAFGARRVMLAALILGAGSSALQMSLPELWLMVPLRIIEGFSHLALVVAAPAMMARVATDNDRPVAMAIWATFFGVSFSLASVLVPWLLSWGDMAAVFGFHACGLTLLALAVFWRAPKSAQAQLSLSFFKLHGVVYGAPRLCAPAIGFVFYTFLYVALLTFLPKILGDGRLGQILPLISLIGTMLTGVAGRYLRTDQLSRVGFLTVIASAVLMMIGLEVAVYPLFFCFGIVPAAQFGMIPELNETQGDRAKAAGAIAQLGNIGTVAGTPVFAVILMMFGANALLWTIVVVSAIGLTAVHLLDRRIRNQ